MGALITPNAIPPTPQKVESETKKTVTETTETTKSQNKITVPSLSKTEMLILTGLVSVILLVGIVIGYYVKSVSYTSTITPLITYQNKLQQKIISIEKLITKEQDQEDVDSERIQRLERNRKIVSETFTNSINFSKTNDNLIVEYINNQTSYLKTNGIFINKTR